MCKKILSLLQFLEEFMKNRFQIFFECLVEFTDEAILSWTFTFGKFFVVISISSLLIRLLRYFSYSWFRLERLHISRNLCISSRVLNLAAHNILVWIFYISVVSVAYFLFHFWFYLSFLSFFLSESTQGFVHLLMFSKKQPFVVSVFFLFCISFSSALIFIFSSADFGLSLFLFFWFS